MQVQNPDKIENRFFFGCPPWVDTQVCETVVTRFRKEARKRGPGLSPRVPGFQTGCHPNVPVKMAVTAARSLIEVGRRLNLDVSSAPGTDRRQDHLPEIDHISAVLLGLPVDPRPGRREPEPRTRHFFTGSQ